MFLSENSEVEKSLPSTEKNGESADLSIRTEPLKGVGVDISASRIILFDTPIL
jgi:hypothetical protein